MDASGRNADVMSEKLSGNEIEVSRSRSSEKNSSYKGDLQILK